MADQFIEDRFTLFVRNGARWRDDFAVEVTRTAGGQEHRRLTHPIPVRRFMIALALTSDTLLDELLDLYWRCFGRFAGFRVKIADDYTTAADGISAPTALDQPLATITAASIYQLQKYYGSAAPVITAGRPVRTLYKPVAGTTTIAIAGDTISNTGRTRWTVDTTTGRVTFSADIADTITAISNAAAAVITVGPHTFVINDSVYISGVSGMTQINGLRGTVTATTGTTISVDIDSTLFSAYTSGGTLNTRPQSGEAVTGGCEFDIPMRFDNAPDVDLIDYRNRAVDSIDLVELIAL